MGNGVTKVTQCCAVAGEISRRYDIDVYVGDQFHKGLGHSFCYIRADPACLSNTRTHSSDETTTFFSISGASVSANTSSSSSTALSDACPYSSSLDEASAFESSDCFAFVPLQPVPRRGGAQIQSGSGSSPIERGFLSGPIERGFLSSGPIERGFLSAPIDPGSYSGLMEKENETKDMQRSFSHGGSEIQVKSKKKKNGLIKSLKRVLSKTISRGKKSIMTPIKGVKESKNGEKQSNLSGEVSLNHHDDDESLFSTESRNLQWAQGKAGEDRVHIVISDENEWVFVGIYDGFNGPDAPDYLLSNLYTNVNQELKGLLTTSKTEETGETDNKENHPNESEDEDCNSIRRNRKGIANRRNCEWVRERLELDRRLKEKLQCNSDEVNHFDVLRALSQALRKTEEAYFEIADEMATEKPELALMGSCVLVMLMKGEDVYLMNVGDSRAVLAQKGKVDVRNIDLEIINEERMRDSDSVDGDDDISRLKSLSSFQLTKDHSTYEHKEVQRIKKEHPDDPCAIMNDRVKGYLKVTRAFGVGFLKQAKWNDLLLEMFQIDYVGKSPYITSFPSFYHHRLHSRDKYLILSSDGLYQYFTNEEVVSQVEAFVAAFPEGDPAQHLIEEVLFRAAKRAGMDFHELLDIPQGERRRYHDDVSIIIISLEGRIWRSSV
ncbi:probable protein phosphatase 2C 4 [Euphorbia lathyris]|uniref:probable protein phosphatase 2C 4 n=1 Tax=Euphorbia lathyris TaxID=212925 RepID=UPI003313C6D7